MMKKHNQLKAVKAEMARQKKRSIMKRRAAVLVFECVLLFFLSAALYIVYNYRRFQKVEINSEDIGINEGISQEGYITVALFGGDSREGALEAGTHADTIIVVSIDNETGEMRMISLYRDTLFKQKDESYNKANFAYFNGGPEEGIAMLNRNLDLDIKEYVTVDFKALVDAIDLVGGLDVEISEEEVGYVNEYIQETADVSGTQANFLSESGELHLDGTQAVTYARIRSTEGGDLTRTNRQRIVIEKLFDKIKTMNLRTVNEITNKVFPQVSTSFSLGKMTDLAKNINHYQLVDKSGFPFECDTSGYYEEAGSVVVPVDMEDNVVRLHAFLYPKEEGYTPTPTVIQISEDIERLTGGGAGDQPPAGENTGF